MVTSALTSISDPSDPIGAGYKNGGQLAIGPSLLLSGEGISTEAVHLRTHSLGKRSCLPGCFCPTRRLPRRSTFFGEWRVTVLWMHTIIPYDSSMTSLVNDSPRPVWRTGPEAPATPCLNSPPCEGSIQPESFYGSDTSSALSRSPLTSWDWYRHSSDMRLVGDLDTLGPI